MAFSRCWLPSQLTNLRSRQALWQSDNDLVRCKAIVQLLLNSRCPLQTGALAQAHL